ncbi:hypothetical protein TNCT_102311 [Trichonephila clavata]|uniref:Uncharacterized protein n=1 Tax=Trichonephila clavata TaxID=2740835 RepID=A0A8X6I2W4_TRICU|nr:hypothetical protein TNCT_102311 [Trichonephila clavata]
MAHVMLHYSFQGLICSETRPKQYPVLPIRSFRVVKFTCWSVATSHNRRKNALASLDRMKAETSAVRSSQARGSRQTDEDR